MKKIPERATFEGTSFYIETHFPKFFDNLPLLGKTGWPVLPVGFGGYRIKEGDKSHEESLIHALKKGCNLIDTASTYGQGKSEILIGRVLQEGIERGDWTRCQFVLISKIGYVQEKDFERMRMQEKSCREEKYPDVVFYSSRYGHCIHPSYLQDQLDKSLERLKISCLDVCLLHNPEYYFMDCLKKKGLISLEDEEEFYNRLRLAFAYLEECVKRKKIQYYGISSGNLKVFPDLKSGSISLKRVLDIAKEVGGDHHHFALIEIPLNLVESSSALDQESFNCLFSSYSLLTYAQGQNLGVVCNRPLNVSFQNKIFRLADSPRMNEEGSEKECQRNLSLLSSFLEKDPENEDLFKMALEFFLNAYKNFSGIPQWNQSKSSKIFKNILHFIQEEDQSKSTFYKKILKDLIFYMDCYFSDLNENFIHPLREKVKKFFPLSLKNQSFASQCIWTLICVPNVNVVLCGMKSVFYVDDILKIYEWDRVSGEEILDEIYHFIH